MALSFLFAFMAGCASVRAPSSPDKPWTPKGKNSFKESSWNNIRSKALDKTKPYPLAELIDIALTNNPQTRDAWEQARIAEARKKQSESAYFPEIDVSGGLTRQKTNSDYGTPYSIDYLNSWPNMQFTYLLLDFGGRCSSVKQSMEQLVAANYNFNQTLQDVVLNVEVAYYGFYSSKSSLKAAESDVVSSKASYDAAQDRYDSGVATKLAMLQARAVYEQSLFSLEDAKGNVMTSKAGLASALGYPADTEFDIYFSTSDFPRGGTLEDVSFIINDAMNKRPDIAALRASIRAQESAVRAARSNLYPTLNLSATYQQDNYKYYSYPIPDLNSDNALTALMSLNWNLFNGFNMVNKLKEQNAALELQKIKLQEAEINASVDVWTKYYDFNTALKKLDAAATYLNTVQNSYDLAFESYKAGLQNIIDLIDAESKLFNAKSLLITSQRDALVALAQLAHATGTIYSGGDKNNGKD